MIVFQYQRKHHHDQTISEVLEHIIKVKADRIFSSGLIPLCHQPPPSILLCSSSAHCFFAVASLSEIGHTLFHVDVMFFFKNVKLENLHVQINSKYL